ncbi:MAG: SCP2 sterol-binding domain-containing protein [Pseudomonadota bacterium]
MLTERIQAAIDHNVAGSPRARELLAQLEGRSMVVRMQFTPWRVRARVLSQRLLVARTQDESADTLLSGTPLALLSLLREPPAEVIRRGAVTLTGDSEVAQQFQELMLLLRPDLEESLAGVIGDVPAHGLGRLLRKSLEYGRASARTVGLNVGEFLAHERHVLVPRAEASEFLAGVDEVREATDRIAARVQALETGTSTTQPTASDRP